MKPVRLLLVDDHTLMRAGLRMLLQNLPGIEIVKEAGNGREALRLVEAHHPQIVLMDIAMPILNGLDATALIKRDFPETKVLILSMYANEEYVVRALETGAAGYLLKDAAPQELERAIDAVLRGDIWLSERIPSPLIDNDEPIEDNA